MKAINLITLFFLLFFFVSCITDEGDLDPENMYGDNSNTQTENEKDTEGKEEENESDSSQNETIEEEQKKENQEEDPWTPDENEVPVEEEEEEEEEIENRRPLEQWGTPGSDEGKGVAVDSEGNVFVTGFTFGRLDGNECNLDSPGQCSRDIFLTKWSKGGSRIWTVQWGTTSGDAGNAVAIDSEGNILVAGYTDGNVFLAKFETDGTNLWKKQWGSSDSDGATDIAIDNEGNIYVAGSSRGSFGGNFNPSAKTCSSNRFCPSSFVTKLDSDGEKLWTQMWGTEGSDEANGVAVSSDGEIFVTGYTDGDLDGENAGGNDIYLAKLDSEGEIEWISQFGTKERDEAMGVVVDDDGNVFITGKTKGDLDGNKCNSAMFGGCTQDTFLAKYDPEGERLWTKQFGSNSDDSGEGISIGKDGFIYTTGWTKGSLGGNAHTGLLPDGFVSKWSSDGNVIWTKLIGTPQNDSASCVAVDEHSNVFVTGVTYGVFPDNMSAGNQDIFLAYFPAQ